MLPVRFVITAHNSETGKRMELFRWCKGEEAGLRRARQEAERNGFAKVLSDYRAEPVEVRS